MCRQIMLDVRGSVSQSKLVSGFSRPIPFTASHVRFQFVLTFLQSSIPLSYVGRSAPNQGQVLKLTSCAHLHQVTVCLFAV